MKNMQNNLVVGAGISGLTVARKLAETGEKVVVIDKRSHIGGNVFDYKIKDIRLSKYGAHIFHTSNEQVWNFINQFSEWSPYKHEVQAIVDGKLVPIPVNITTVNTLFDEGIETTEQMDTWLESKQIKFDKITNSKEAALSRVGPELYELIFEPYTKKQWGVDASLLEPSVLERIPVRNNWETGYFSDSYEALPKYGYTAFCEELANHKNIKIELSKSHEEISKLKFDKVIFTGKIDSYFSDSLGKLGYRSLRFERNFIEQGSGQSKPVVNYPSSDYAFTRLIDYKLFQDHYPKHSIVVSEFPSEMGEPYYPIPSDENRKLYKLYQKEAKKLESSGVFFLGRLAEYKYFNMDQAIASALSLAARIAG